MGYNVVSFNSANLGGNIYIDNVVGCVLDIGAVALVTGILKKFKRRNALAFLLAAVACFSVLTPFVKQGAFVPLP